MSVSRCTLILTLLVAGCAASSRTPMSTVRADVERSPAPEFDRLYTYYPEHEVYYSPAQDNYYWQAGGEWVSGVDLPSSINLTGSPCRIVTLPTDRPYHEHELVLAEFGDGSSAVVVAE